MTLTNTAQKLGYKMSLWLRKLRFFVLFPAMMVISCRHSTLETPDEGLEHRRMSGGEQPAGLPQSTVLPQSSGLPQSTVLPKPGSTGCGQSALAKGVEDESIQVAGQSRKYLLVMPENYDSSKRYALVFWWHGAGSSPELTRGVPNFNHSPNLEKIARDSAIFIHPRQIPGVGTTWDLSDNGGDLLLFDSIYEEATKNYCVDLSKVFTIGVSNGAMFANHLASKRPDKIRGVVTVAMPAIGGAWQKVAMRSMLVQDDRDNFGSAQITLQKMADDGNCMIDANKLSPQNPNACFALNGCAAETLVAFCPWQVKEGWNPHDWPRFDDADNQIWQFLNADMTAPSNQQQIQRNP